MVFIHVPQHRPAVEPTREELELLDELERRGVPPLELEAALTARGIPPGRARQLAVLVTPPPPTRRLLGLLSTGLWVLLAVFVALGERPLRRWVREHWPGQEWIVGLLVPLLVLAVFLATLLTRLRAARRARESVTHADQIENRPIG